MIGRCYPRLGLKLPQARAERQRATRGSSSVASRRPLEAPFSPLRRLIPILPCCFSSSQTTHGPGKEDVHLLYAMILRPFPVLRSSTVGAS